MENKPIPPRRIPARDYAELRDTARKAQAEHDRAQGALDELEKQLKADFDCENIEAAQELLVVLEAEEAAMKIEFEKEFAKYQEEWNAIS